MSLISFSQQFIFLVFYKMISLQRIGKLKGKGPLFTTVNLKNSSVEDSVFVLVLRNSFCYGQIHKVLHFPKFCQYVSMFGVIG